MAVPLLARIGTAGVPFLLLTVAFQLPEDVNEIAFELQPQDIVQEQLLGKGQYGFVYRGRCRQLPVAFKVFQNQDPTDDELEDLRTELMIMRSLRHPNIISCLGACTVPGNIKIVTELMEGDLETLLEKNKELSLFQRMKMAKGIALGLTWLHNASPPIIHRDLKPSNILVRVVTE